MRAARSPGQGWAGFFFPSKSIVVDALRVPVQGQIRVVAPILLLPV